MRALTAHLEGGYRLSKLLKRTALAFGVPEGRIEQVKHWRAVRALMRVRNSVALARASRPRGKGRA
jgi:hypothetical protein